MTRRFCVYGSATSPSPGVTLEELLDLAASGDLLARVENSGSEGLYVEVARWKYGEDCHSGAWHRYAFRKCLGGEPSGALQDAQCLADTINAASGAGLTSLVHKLPDWPATT